MCRFGRVCAGLTMEGGKSKIESKSRSQVGISESGIDDAVQNLVAAGLDGGYPKMFECDPVHRDLLIVSGQVGWSLTALSSAQCQVASMVLVSWFKEIKSIYSSKNLNVLFMIELLHYLFYTSGYGKVLALLWGNPKFNFHKYTISALEDDFRQVFGISSPCNKNDFQCEDIRLVEWSSWRHMNKQKLEELILPCKMVVSFHRVLHWMLLIF
ncbi:unnamed protein product [Lupinus luteus]|uniref:Uncharacterized protein n=1 Tax=Lupinus luteus TaxID=3873 RepID=A0AAV1XCM3_LUPLU